MAYIHSFKILGLAGHDEPVKRELDRHVNVFWGLNGTGKTSLLKILDAALNNTVLSLERVPFSSAEVVFWSENHQTLIRRTYEKDADSAPDESNVELEEVGDGMWQEVLTGKPTQWTTEEVLTTEGLMRTEGGEPITARKLAMPFKHAYLPISRLSQLMVHSRPPTQRTRVVDDSYLDDQFAEQVRIRWQNYNSTALATIRGIQQQGLAAILAILFGGGTMAAEDGYGVEATRTSDDVIGQDAYRLVRGFLSEQGISLGVNREEFLQRYENEPALREVVSSIEETTGRVDLALKPQHAFTQVIEMLYSGGKTLVLDPSRGHHQGLRVEMDDALIPLESLSSGEKQLLRLMLEVLAADANTVMIDEPELSLHVDWQQVLVASMQKVNPECQMLLATHSPEVMADVPDELVFQL
jgi:predicted ATP-binding protein involved in virulence